MAKDDRIFRVTKYGRTSYKTRTAVSAIFASAIYGRSKSERGFGVSELVYTNAEATDGWTDCLEEFKHPEKTPDRCKYHPQYKGVRKPTYRSPDSRYCTCWAVYAKAHSLPAHAPNCPKPNSDPLNCGCLMHQKIFG